MLTTKNWGTQVGWQDNFEADMMVLNLCWWWLYHFLVLGCRFQGRGQCRQHLKRAELALTRWASARATGWWRSSELFSGSASKALPLTTGSSPVPSRMPWFGGSKQSQVQRAKRCAARNGRNEPEFSGGWLLNLKSLETRSSCCL